MPPSPPQALELGNDPPEGTLTDDVELIAVRQDRQE
jgi:hypothetical protein